VFLVAAAPPAFAGKVAKVDLTPYLDGDAHVGDFRVYDRDDGATVTSEVTEVVELKKSTLLASDYTEDGHVETDFGEIVHGKEFRVGSVLRDSGVSFLVPKPKRVEPFFLAPGVPQKFKIGYSLVLQGRRAGHATRAGTVTFVGFVQEVPGTNPLGASAHPIAQFHREQTLTVKVGKTVFVTTSTGDSWVTLEYGTVRRTDQAQSFKNGVPTSTFGPFVYTLDHGQFNGTPFP
jgi:hypothetical protein